ncbi:metal-dependent hydrolase [Flavobacterium cauense R2A-7]|uniref:DinB family protein n=1 Tax=Flavobacterium cauense R2A-7 TaxID=1341154 RepID=V6S6J7_9FLAO|nr:putative metal-dependent hydrolase [Flavobacterium cauense]ESU21892.1 metal-dependent hydrolase [Flavobacterium cauense R2A-7]TWI13109.1 DinB family protein [Flavobacterium cauense R2A-7]
MKNNIDIEKLKFPIGRFVCPPEISAKNLEYWKATLKAFPKELKAVTENLSVTELNWTYRPEGWKIKQVIHHLADSHMNALIRIKLTLTEDAPVIRPYEEALWAELPDGFENNIHSSLKIIEGVHERWSHLLENLSENDWNKMYFHPEHQRLFSIKEAVGIYDWHCRHHLAHIEQALSLKGTFN